MRAASRITRKPKKHTAATEPRSLLLHGVSWDAYELMLEVFAEEHVRMTYDEGDLELSGPNMGGGERSSLLVYGVSWDNYERLLKVLEDTHVRLIYDEGTLELMAPSFNHEWWKRRIAALLFEFFVELGINFQGAGSTTFKRQAQRQGIEPDECFYIKNVDQITGKRELDLRRDPPPDLALEVDVTTNAAKRFPIYAKLGVPELWVYDETGLHICRLGAKGKYRQVKKSVALPLLPIDDFHRFLVETQELSEFDMAVEFRKWLKTHFPRESRQK